MSVGISRASSYGFINAKLRARISEMLPREWMMKMAGTRSLTEAVSMLDNTAYRSASEAYQRTGDLKLVEAEILKLERDDILTLERYLTPSAAELTTAMLLQYEIETVKNALRLWFMRTVAERSVEGVIAYVDSESVAHRFSTDHVLNADDETELVEAFSDTPYLHVIRDQVAEVIARRSLFPLEMALDRWYFEQVNTAVELLDRVDQSVAKRLLGIRIDMVNLHWIARIREYQDLPENVALGSLLPGGAAFDAGAIASIYRSDSPSQVIANLITGRYGGVTSMAGESDDIRRLTLLSSILQQVLLHEIHRVLGGYPFSVGVIVAYVFLRQNEARMIRTVLNARYYALEPAAIGGMI